jgi:hypothetical protein
VKAITFYPPFRVTHQSFVPDRDRHWISTIAAACSGAKPASFEFFSFSECINHGFPVLGELLVNVDGNGTITLIQ